MSNFFGFSLSPPDCYTFKPKKYNSIFKKGPKKDIDDEFYTDFVEWNEENESTQGSASNHSPASSTSPSKKGEGIIDVDEQEAKNEKDEGIIDVDLETEKEKKDEKNLEDKIKKLEKEKQKIENPAQKEDKNRQKIFIMKGNDRIEIAAKQKMFQKHYKIENNNCRELFQKSKKQEKNHYYHGAFEINDIENQPLNNTADKNNVILSDIDEKSDKDENNMDTNKNACNNEGNIMNNNCNMNSNGDHEVGINDEGNSDAIFQNDNNFIDNNINLNQKNNQKNFIDAEMFVPDTEKEKKKVKNTNSSSNAQKTTNSMEKFPIFAALKKKNSQNVPNIPQKRIKHDENYEKYLPNIDKNAKFLKKRSFSSFS